MKKQIGIWDGGTKSVSGAGGGHTVPGIAGTGYLVFDEPNTLSPQKRKSLIDKIKRQMREKRGIIIGLQTPPERHKDVLTKTRRDLEELAVRLKELQKQQ